VVWFGMFSLVGVLFYFDWILLQYGIISFYNSFCVCFVFCKSIVGFLLLNSFGYIVNQKSRSNPMASDMNSSAESDKKSSSKAGTKCLI